jgi:uncharacterized protein (DUF2062 family)
LLQAGDTDQKSQRGPAHVSALPEIVDNGLPKNYRAGQQRPMPKRTIKRFMPDPHAIREHKYLRFLGKLLHDPNILHLNRRSVSGAFSVGLFMALMPIPFQMVLAAIGAIVVRVNLPISVTLVWITNPLTIPPMFYFSYKVGTWILGLPTRAFEFQLSIEWLMAQWDAIWQPLLLGSFVCGTLAAAVSNVAIRILWRVQVGRNWRRRRQQRRADKIRSHNP